MKKSITPRQDKCKTLNCKKEQQNYPTYKRTSFTHFPIGQMRKLTVQRICFKLHTFQNFKPNMVDNLKIEIFRLKFDSRKVIGFTDNESVIRFFKLKMVDLIIKFCKVDKFYLKMFILEKINFWFMVSSMLLSFIYLSFEHQEIIDTEYEELGIAE